MQGKKELLAQCLAAGRITPLVSHLRSLFENDLQILAYHRVWDVSDDVGFSHDVELISASVEDFGWQLQHVQQNFTPITFETLGRIIDGRERCPRRPILITFDDGYEDNFEIVFPILHASGIPAKMFLSTDYIGTDRTFWFDHLAHLLLTTHRTTVFVGTLGVTLELGDVASRRKAIRTVLSQLKRIPNDRRLAVIDELDAALDGDSDHSATFDSRPMTWEQVRKMAAHGIEIGSHTVTHPILANVDDATLTFELCESKRAIERQINRPVSAISYPVGGKSAADDRVFAAVRDAGYRFEATYLPGTNSFSTPNHLALRRLHVERYTDRAYFSAMLNMPAVFGC